MLIAFVGLLAMQVGSVPASQAESIPTISLAEAIRLAPEVSPTAVAARGQLGTFSWARRAAVGALVTPSLTVGGNANSLTPQIFNFNVLSPGQSFASLSSTSHTTDANIQLSYTLFGGGQSFSRLRAARAARAAAQANHDAVRSSS